MPTLENRPRVQSIDLLRGIVMIIMALDHVRDYFHADAFFYDPTDLSQTNSFLFFTRFITHYCAPVFVFLAGTSAFFVGQRRGKKELSIWLVKRGIWLIVLEFTIIELAWMFQLDFSSLYLLVIWVLGASMIFLAAVIHLPWKWAVPLCLLVVFGHNAFDAFQPAEGFAELWTLLHVFSPISVGGLSIFVAYPLIPWIFVMPLGYYFGILYSGQFSQEQRVKYLKILGVGLIGLFVFGRLINLYGDPVPWSSQDSLALTVMSFFNVSKYPPSLFYLLVTLGPAILLLAYTENWKGRLQGSLVTVGRVPMFYYIVHIYIIHFLALIAAVLTGYSASDMVTEVWVTMSPELQGYGFDLWVTYAVWLAVVLVLYPLCKRYDRYKSQNRDKWWLSYL